MKARTLGTLLLAVALCWGCKHWVPEEGSSDTPSPPDVRFEGKIVLGSPSLTAGIPGSGPLTSDQIRVWLADPEVHRTLAFTLPLGLRDVEHLVWMPPENPLTRAKIELGRQLFFDKRLSGHGTFACGTCHLPEQDFSAYMVMPEIGRNPPVCFNRILSKRQFWDGRAEALEDQIEGPISNPFEMNSTPEKSVAQMKAIAGYQQQFDVIFGRLDMKTIGFALASFQRALVTGPAPWDYHRLLKAYDPQKLDSLSQAEQQQVEQLRADVKTYPMSESALRGESLFFGNRTQCGRCHAGPNLTDELYHNVGVGMEHDEPDLGRYEVTEKEADIGAFKTPTLRNIENTPPYMHDGRFDTLSQVIDWFDQGGFMNKHLDTTMRPLHLTHDEKHDLVAFLQSLRSPLPPVETSRLPE